MSRRYPCILALVFCFQVIGQNNFSLNQLGPLWSSTPPLTFGTTISNDGVTLVDTSEGRATYSFNGSQSLLTVDTQGDTYTSTVNNVKFTPGPSTNTLSGENLQFSSTISESRTNIDRFSFSGGNSEFRFRLQNFETTGPTNWGGESLNFRRANEENTVNATKVYIRRENGEYIDIGEADYSEANKSLELTSVLGQYDGTDFSADQLSLMQRGDTDLGRATNLYIGKGPDEFVRVGTADVRVSPNRTSLSLTSLSGASDGYDFSADTFNYTETGGSEAVNATGVFVRNQNGEFIQIGEADYSEANKSLELTSVLGQSDGTDFSADQLSLMQRGDTDLGSATNLYIANGAGDFISVGRANITVGPLGDSLSLTSVTGAASGYDLSADHLDATSIGENTNIIIVNGLATKEGERLSFGNAVLDSDGESVHADIANLSFSNGDVAFSADSFLGSTNGESFDLNTAGILRTGGTDLNLSFEGRGINSLAMSGPAEDGGILLEKSGGRVIRAAGTVSLGTTEDGGISDIGVALGESISFSATDADGNARELTASFSYDEAAGKFFLKTVFSGGDETEIKVFPFSFTSEKIGDDAVAALSASLETQNIEDYLTTMSRIIDLERINDFIAVGQDRMQVRIGREQGLEFYYADNDLNILNGVSDFPHNNSEGRDIALSLGYFNRGSDNSVTSGGVLFSSDSSLRYNVEAGTLSFNGVDLPDRGEIPLTIGAYYRHEDDDGNAVFGTLGTSLADLGSVSAGVTVQRELNDYTNYSVGMAGNSDGDIAASVGLQIFFQKRVNDSPRKLINNNYDPRQAGEMAESLRDYRAISR